MLIFTAKQFQTNRFIEMKTIFVTGGAGFIGSALIRYLITDTNTKVINIDKLTYAGNLSSLKSVMDHPNYTFIHADICNNLAMKQALELHQPDLVMHLAAESHVDRSIDGPAAFIQTNIVGTYNLLEVTRAYWQGLAAEKKNLFVFIIFRPMKSMEIWEILICCLQKKRLMIQALLIQLRKPVQIT